MVNQIVHNLGIPPVLPIQDECDELVCSFAPDVLVRGEHVSAFRICELDEIRRNAIGHPPLILSPTIQLRSSGRPYLGFFVHHATPHV
jgi:hypothetical protein